MRQYYSTLADHFADLSEWFGKIGDWYNVMSWRQSDAAYFRQIEGQMFEIAKVYRAMAQDEEEREKMRNTLLTSVMLVLALVFLLAVMPAGAQDDPAATAAIQPVIATLDGVPVEATLVAPGDEQPPVVVVNQQPSDNTFYVVGLLIFLGFTGFLQFLNHRNLNGFRDSINKALDNKQVLSEMQQRYMEASMTTQEYAKLLTNIAGFVGAMIPGEDMAEKLNRFGQQVISGEKPPGDVTVSGNPDINIEAFRRL